MKEENIESNEKKELPEGRGMKQIRNFRSMILMTGKDEVLSL